MQNPTETRRIRSHVFLACWISFLTSLALFLATPGFADIDSVERLAPCHRGSNTNFPMLERGTNPTVMVRGDWQDYATSVSCATSGCRITGRVVRKGGGFTRQGPFAELRLNVPNNEGFGVKTIRVTHRTAAGVGTDTFQAIVARPQVTRVSAGNSPSTFFDRMTITIQGNELPTQRNGVNIRLITGLQGGSQLQGGASGIRVTDRQWIRDSSTRGRLILQFADRMQRAVIDVMVSNPTRRCAIWNAAQTHRVTLETTQRDTRNYVSQIRPDTANQLAPGNLVSFTVRLREPVGRSSSTSGRTSRLRPRPQLPTNLGETVYWRVLPSSSFRATDGNSRLPNLSQLRIAPGRQEGVIQFFIDQCSGSATSMSATLETFMHDTSAATAPNRVTRTFRVSCPRRN